MFNNIGAKIKVFVVIMFCVLTIAMIIVGIALCSAELPVVGVVVMIVGPLMAWISSFVLYGFGQIIENTDEIVAYNSRQNTLQKFERKAIDEMQKDEILKKGGWSCKCGKVNPHYTGTCSCGRTKYENT